jgi:hypothetical protein
MILMGLSNHAYWLYVDRSYLYKKWNHTCDAVPNKNLRWSLRMAHSAKTRWTIKMF